MKNKGSENEKISQSTQKRYYCKIAFPMKSFNVEACYSRKVIVFIAGTDYKYLIHETNQGIVI